VERKLRELREAQSKTRGELLEEVIELYKKTEGPRSVY
jgi:hypothetical protein